MMMYLRNAKTHCIRAYVRAFIGIILRNIIFIGGYDRLLFLYTTLQYIYVTGSYVRVANLSNLASIQQAIQHCNHTRVGACVRIPVRVVASYTLLLYRRAMARDERVSKQKKKYQYNISIFSCKNNNNLDRKIYL